ncbi:MAG: type II secretion system protein [Planctomycetota bacterium]
MRKQDGFTLIELLVVKGSCLQAPRPWVDVEMMSWMRLEPGRSPSRSSTGIMTIKYSATK